MISDWRKKLAWGLGLGVAAIIGGFVVISLSIGLGVKAISSTAMNQHTGDRVEALIAHVKCETCSLGERNRAVWALGQLGDERALPVLDRYFTGKPCDHSRGLCQRELKNAIKLLEG